MFSVDWSENGGQTNHLNSHRGGGEMSTLLKRKAYRLNCPLKWGQNVWKMVHIYNEYSGKMK